MAIKGKKKSRGSQARRRPAAAPRPAVAVRRKDPWYNTALGRVIAAILVVLVIAGIGTAIAINRSNANKEKDKLQAVEDYVSELRAILQSATGPAGGMSQIAAGAPPDQLETLKEDANGWVTTLEAAASRATASVPPEEVGNVNGYFVQSLQLYVSSARMLGDAANTEGDTQTNLLQRASEIRAQADGVMTNAITDLDEVLGELGGDPSGLQPLGISAAAANPQAPPTLPGDAPTAPAGEGEGEGQGGEGGAGEGEGGGQGGGNNNGGGDGEDS